MAPRAGGRGARGRLAAAGAGAAAADEAPSLGVREAAAPAAEYRGGGGGRPAPCWWISQDAPPPPLRPAASPRLPSAPRAGRSRAGLGGRRGLFSRLLPRSAGGLCRGGGEACGTRWLGDPDRLPPRWSCGLAALSSARKLEPPVRARRAPRGKGPRRVRGRGVERRPAWGAAGGQLVDALLGFQDLTLRVVFEGLISQTAVAFIAPPSQKTAGTDCFTVPFTPFLPRGCWAKGLLFCC